MQKLQKIPNPIKGEQNSKIMETIHLTTNQDPFIKHEKKLNSHQMQFIHSTIQSGKMDQKSFYIRI